MRRGSQLGARARGEPDETLGRSPGPQILIFQALWVLGRAPNQGAGDHGRELGNFQCPPLSSTDGAQRAGLPAGDAVACLAALALSVGPYGGTWGWRNEGFGG